MQIVIDIPEDVFKRTVFYREFRDLNDYIMTIKALENAVSIPKGHGKIIDANTIHDLRIRGVTEYCRGYNDRTTEVENDIKNAPAIIETDKSKSEE